MKNPCSAAGRAPQATCRRGILANIGGVEYNQAVTTTLASFVYSVNIAGGDGSFDFRIDGNTVVSTITSVFLASVNNLGGAGGQHAYRWCITAGASAGDILWIDDVSLQ